jgi:hypothetical protein
VTTFPGHSPEANIGDRVFSDPLLFVARIEDHRSIADPPG